MHTPRLLLRAAAVLLTGYLPTFAGITIVESELEAESAGLAGFYQYGVAVDLDGDTAVVGSHMLNSMTGGVFVFTRWGDAWTQQALLTPSGGAAGDHFGLNAAIEGDTIVVGSPLQNAEQLADSGVGYVYVRSGESWSEQAILSANDVEAGALFGQAVAISGETIAVRASLAAGPLGADQGAVYVFIRSGGAWTQQAKLTAADGAIGSSMIGTALAIHGDTLVVGAPGATTPSGTGCAYVFVRETGAWSQQAKIVPSGTRNFGFSMSLSGNTLIVGSPDDSGPAGMNQGSAFVYRRLGGVWSQDVRLHAAPGAPFGQFGWSVAVQNDWGAVGALYGDYVIGKTYIYSRTGSNWNFETAVIPPSDGVSDDWSGWSVALNADTLLVGAPFFSGPGHVDEGRVFSYRLTIPGDLNCDTQINADDAERFVQSLLDPEGASESQRGCSILHADVNEDGRIDGEDIGPFVGLLLE